MFGIGMQEMIVIAVIALIFIGPDQIPEVARTVGRFLNDLRRSTDDLKDQFRQQSGLPNSLDDINVIRRRASISNHAVPPTESDEQKEDHALGPHHPIAIDAAEEKQMSLDFEASQPELVPTNSVDPAESKTIHKKSESES